MVTQLPGFTDAVHDAQRTFRALLDALARPGLGQSTVTVNAPAGLTPSCAAACLTVLDLETLVWLQPGIADDVRPWLVFHTGCRFIDSPKDANFALIWNLATAPALDTFQWGSSEYPEASTSLLIQLPGLESGPAVALAGPGISQSIELTLPLEKEFWSQWQDMTADYPLGLDCWFFAQDQVMGLPRTAKLMSPTEKL